MISQSTIDAVNALQPHQILNDAAVAELAFAPLSDWAQLPGMAFGGKAMAAAMFAVHQSTRYMRLQKFGRTYQPRPTPDGTRAVQNLQGILTATGMQPSYQAAFNSLYPASSDPFKQFLVIGALAVGAIVATGGLASSPLMGGGAAPGATAATTQVPATVASVPGAGMVGGPSVGGSLTNSIVSSGISGGGGSLVTTNSIVADAIGTGAAGAGTAATTAAASGGLSLGNIGLSDVAGMAQQGVGLVAGGVSAVAGLQAALNGPKKPAPVAIPAPVAAQPGGINMTAVLLIAGGLLAAFVI